MALPGGQVLAFKGDAGTIDGRSGQDVTIIDRAFIGNPMPRGFAFGGIGPRDFVDGSVDTALGGNSYLTPFVQVRFNTPSPKVTVGVFADAGGAVDDTYDLRTSVGFSVYWDTQIGVVQLNLANPVSKKPPDKVEHLSVNRNFQF